MGVCFESKDKRKDSEINNPSQTIIMLEQKIKEIELRINNLEKRINDLLAEAKAKIKCGDKAGAKRILIKKNKLLSQKEQKEGELNMLEDQKMNLENALATKDIFDTIKQANQQIKEGNKEIALENLENLKEEMENIKEEQNEVNDVLAGSAEVEESEVDEELDKLFQEMANEVNENMPELNSNFDNSEDNELNKEKDLKITILEGCGPKVKKKNPVKKKEIIKMEKEKKKILDKQKEFRIRNPNTSIFNKKEEVKEILEDMCIIGSIMKKEIIEEKKYNPEKFITTKKALSEKNNKQIFCLGVLAQNLENFGIVTAIEKNPNNDEESQNASNTVLQFITNGLMNKNKYNFHFDFGTQRNNELLTNKIEQEKFNNKLRKKLSIEYKIPESKIILTNPQKGSYEIQVIFETDEFNEADVLNMDKFRAKCQNDNNFKELSHLKTIHKSLIMEGCMLSENMLDSEGNRESGWEVGGKRGGYPYYPPEGWKGFGLKVKGKYDEGNDDWLAYDGNSNEWAVAYHGIGTKLGMTLEKATHNIIAGGFKAGKGQAYEYDDDANHPGQKVGKGVYCSPQPSVMDSYAHSTNVNGKSYKMGFMMRVKPDKIRYSNNMKDYWVLDGTTEEMRPYRILIKEN